MLVENDFLSLGLRFCDSYLMSELRGLAFITLFFRHFPYAHGWLSSLGDFHDLIFQITFQSFAICRVLFGLYIDTFYLVISCL